MRPRFRRTCLLISTLAITLTLAPRTTLAHGHAGWVIWHGGWTGTSSFVPQVFGMPATTMVYTPTAPGTGVIPVVPFSSISFVPQNSFGTTGVVPQVPFGTSSIATVPIYTAQLLEPAAGAPNTASPMLGGAAPTATTPLLRPSGVAQGAAGATADYVSEYNAFLLNENSLHPAGLMPASTDIAAFNQRHTALTNAIGAQRLGSIGRFLIGKLKDRNFRNNALKLFEPFLGALVPGLSPFLPLVNAFLDDLQQGVGGTTPAPPAPNGPAEPTIPGDNTMTIRVILVGEDGKPAKVPGGVAGGGVPPRGTLNSRWETSLVMS